MSKAQLEKMKKILTSTLFLMIFFVPIQSSGFEGTDIWTEGDGIEYSVDLYSGTDTTPFYDLEGYQYWIDYLGVENGSMQFYNHVDRVYIAEWYFGGYEGQIFEVDPSTGVNDLGLHSFMFFDTSSWSVGTHLGFNFSQKLPDETVIFAEYEVLEGKQTKIVAGRQIEYWVIGFDDMNHINGSYNYVFKDYAIEVTNNGGVMIGKTENYTIYTDKNNDTEFSEDEKGYHLNIEFSLTNISENLESLWVTTNDPRSTSQTSTENKAFLNNVDLVFHSLVFIGVMFKLNKKSKRI